MLSLPLSEKKKPSTPAPNSLSFSISNPIIQMALSKNANLLPSMVNGIAFAITRCGFSRASSMMVRKQGEDKKVVVMMREGGIESSSSWVPDPITGFYKPANRVGEIDPAELREIQLNNKTVVSQRREII